MSCYFRHMQDVFAEAGIQVTKENKKELDKALHHLVGVTYKNCSQTWKGLKGLMAVEESRRRLVQNLKDQWVGKEG